MRIIGVVLALLLAASQAFGVVVVRGPEPAAGDVTAPAFASASIDSAGTTLTVNWTEASSSVSRGGSYSDGGWTLSCSTTTGLTVAYNSGDASTTWTLDISGGPVQESGTDTCTISWAGTAAGIVDPTGNYNAGITTEAVTNGSMQGSGTDCAGVDLYCQNLEATGYDNGETWYTSGTTDPNYTTDPLRGSQSLHLTGDSYSYPILATPQSDFYGFTRVKASTLVTGKYVVRILDASSNTLASIIWITPTDLRGTHGSTIVTTTVNSVSFTTGTLYYLWFHYVAATSGDGVLQIWLSTTATQPASPGINISTGTATASVSRIRHYSESTEDKIFDQMMGSTTAIGSVAP